MATPGKRHEPEPGPVEPAPFAGPEWEDEDDLSVEWDEDWAWDAENDWEDAPAPRKS